MGLQEGEEEAGGEAGSYTHTQRSVAKGLLLGIHPGIMVRHSVTLFEKTALADATSMSEHIQERDSPASP